MDTENKARCCESCGGLVGEDGLAVELPPEEAHEAAESPEYEASEEKRASAFADAMKHRKGA